MRKLYGLLSIMLLISFTDGFAQTNIRPDSPKYEQLKREGKLLESMVNNKVGKDQIITPFDFLRQQSNETNNTNNFNALCQCLMTVDGTWQVVPFTNGVAPEYRNDDGSSPLINLPFNFNFYGQTLNQVYINNNGNISFGAPYFQFVTNPFPSTQFVMIAPFWADVDTRLPLTGPISGLVYYKITPTYMVVQWDSVGYFNVHNDKKNTFQVIITDGVDPILPSGNNVDFCYGDMQWTTGDASMGVGGFGGSPATVGSNSGNGTDYIQFGQFDQPGYGYDGPFGGNDSVDFLDNQNFIFNTFTSGGALNIPPIIQGLVVCDTITICATSSNFIDTIPIGLNFLSPEQNQITTIGATFNGSGIFTIIHNVPGPVAQFYAELVLSSQSIGQNSLTLTATDDFNPPGISTITIIFKVDTFPLTIPSISGSNFYCDVPNATGVTLYAPENFIGYHWSNNITGVDSINVLTGTYNVELTNLEGCKAKTPAFPVWAISPYPVIGGITAFCGADSAHLETTQPFAHYQWLLGGTPTGDTTAVLDLGPTNSGLYSVLVTDSIGCTATSPALYVDLHPLPLALFSASPAINALGGDSIHFFDISTAGSGSINGWLWNFGDGANSTSTLQNPYHVYDSAGMYTVTLTVTQSDGCTNTYSRIYTVESDAIEITNIITPNGDNKNEFFAFKNLEFFPNSRLQVFNRWGKKIYENNNYDNKWNGDDAKEGVYFYILKMPDKDAVKGTVTIKR